MYSSLMYSVVVFTLIFCIIMHFYHLRCLLFGMHNEYSSLLATQQCECLGQGYFPFRGKVSCIHGAEDDGLELLIPVSSSGVLGLQARVPSPVCGAAEGTKGVRHAG